MEIKEENIYKKQEDLSIVVEPLVDSISELVLSSVNGSFENVQSCCIDIAERTNKLVLVAQQTAVSSLDVDLQMEVANGINQIAKTIENLVSTFTVLLKNSNPQTKQAFAEAAKDVGEAINKLCAATDQTSQRKILRAIKEAAESSKQVEESATLSSEKLVTAAQLNVEKILKLIQIVTFAASSTADEKKKKLLLEGCDNLKIYGPALIQAAKIVNERPNDRFALNDLSNKLSQLTEIFNMIVNAANISTIYFGKVNETYEYIKKLINTAKELEKASANFYSTTKLGNQQQFIESAKLAGHKALLLIQQGENAANLEKNVVKKQLIKDAVSELRDSSQEMIKIAKAYRENPNDPILKAQLQQAHQKLEAVIHQIISLTGNDSMNIDNTPKRKFEAALTALESASKAVFCNAKNDPSFVLEDIENLKAIVSQFIKDGKDFAETIKDPNEKKKFLANVEEIRKKIDKVISAANDLSQNPDDVGRQKKLEETYNDLLYTLGQLKEFSNQISEDFDENKINFQVGEKEEQQLVSAAKEEAEAALQLANEAEKKSNKMTNDPIRKQKLQAAIKEVRECSRQVIEVAELVSVHPQDVQAQEKLSAVQKKLGTAIQKVVDLADANDQNHELSEAMAEMTLANDRKSDILGKEGEIIKTAENFLNEIELLFANPNKKLTAQETISNAKELSTKAQTLSKQLMEITNNIQDPIFKEKLLHSAKIVRDSGIQIKILSAVRAAGGEDKGNTLGNSVKGLQKNIREIIKEVKAESIKNRYRNTVKQTMAINKVVNAWKNQK